VEKEEAGEKEKGRGYESQVSRRRKSALPTRRPPPLPLRLLEFPSLSGRSPKVRAALPPLATCASVLRSGWPFSSARAAPTSAYGGSLSRRDTASDLSRPYPGQRLLGVVGVVSIDAILGEAFHAQGRAGPGPWTRPA
jgi:hypothetical protein